MLWVCTRSHDLINYTTISYSFLHLAKLSTGLGVARLINGLICWLICRLISGLIGCLLLHHIHRCGGLSKGRVYTIVHALLATHGSGNGGNDHTHDHNGDYDARNFPTTKFITAS